ncbi:MAG: exodeoxyribonuclease VII large subunit [Sulfuritalea sp.]|uniref:exodeoxyribonuclease VII large subunit n=1 Tax=Sulfuritalea sp. TaxID=2480090 RepID=UPI001AC54A6B|nr:exodeoxyribonuclease VII large subunit [Sulfuritalea sp.]MBK9350471.1 exodeoxyribonuclease VII large subunit [Sulfuritalea sp.]MBN8475958.1 exodeoxyribonuclease VII large subunit [Sulfuritalea sp.]
MLDPSIVLSVSELNRLVRRTLEQGFPLLWVTGEISNLTRAASGHVYFSIKDDSAQARCVMFRARAMAIPWKLENGLQVEARATVSLYEPRGEFQLSIETLRQAGLGRLFEAFARLKARLAGEGLFAAERKRELPRFPRRIGIVSSPKAAALRDVLVTLRRRAPHLQVILYPTLVQGDKAAAEIAQAIAVAARRNECDLLLIVRGGGSIEDLWAFNEEVVARAILASALPTVCGVGHETDTTIADYVADLRAATPTAAAELATRGWHDAAGLLAERGGTLARAMQSRIVVQQQRLDQISLHLIHPAVHLNQSHSRLTLLSSLLDASLARHLGRYRERLNRAVRIFERVRPRTDRHNGRLGLLAQRLAAAARHQQQRRHIRLGSLAAALRQLDPEATLARGYSIVRDRNGALITDGASLHPGQVVSLQLARGSAEASIVSAASAVRPIAT